MSRHLERLLQLDTLLRSSQWNTIKTLAEALEVSERTVRNDLAFLRDRYHAPIAWNRKQGHHYAESEWRLETIPLTQGELFALTLGARLLDACSGSAYHAVLQSAIEQLSRRLPEATWFDVQSLTEERFSLNAGASIQLDAELWQRLETACQRHQRVWMRYFVPDRNQITERQFDPYLIYLCRGNPYTIGYCQLRQDIRWFRIDRIRSLELLEVTFAVDASFDPKQYFAKIFQFEVGGKPQAVAIWFDATIANYIRERVWHRSQRLEEHGDGALTLHLEVSGMNDIKRWVLGYGKGARVLAPPELVALVKAEVQGLYQQYFDADP